MDRHLARHTEKKDRTQIKLEMKEDKLQPIPQKYNGS